MFRACHSQSSFACFYCFALSCVLPPHLVIPDRSCFFFFFLRLSCVCVRTGALKNLGVGITDAVMLGDQVVGLVGILGKVHVRGKRHVWLSSRRQQHRRCDAALQRICLTGSLAHTLADVFFVRGLTRLLIHSLTDTHTHTHTITQALTSGCRNSPSLRRSFSCSAAVVVTIMPTALRTTQTRTC